MKCTFVKRIFYKISNALSDWKKRHWKRIGRKYNKNKTETKSFDFYVTSVFYFAQNFVRNKIEIKLEQKQKSYDDTIACFLFVRF